MRDKALVPHVGLVIVLALVLLAAAPLLARPGLPRDTDAELHVFRTAEVFASWQEGVLYPRWASDFYYGYGYPIFNYYAPLTYHLGGLVALLPGLGVVAGVKGVFLLGFLLGGVGTYLLARDLFGTLAGVVGAATFLFSPYFLFVDPHARGDLAEHFAIGLLPLAAFSLRLLVARGGRLPLLASTIFIASLPLSHNLLGVAGLVFLLAAFVWQVLVEDQRDGVGRGMLAFGLAGAISAFFWLPLLLELDAVQLTVVGPGHFDFRQHFVSLTELLTPSRLLDLGAVAPRYRHNVGLAQWLLALGGGIAWQRRDTPSRGALLFFLLAALGLIFMMTPAARFVWEIVPGLEYLQFPWRLLGTAALALAVPAGAAVALLPQDRRRPAAQATLLLGILLPTLPLTFPHPWDPDFGDTSPVGILAFEMERHVLGTTSTGDFLPDTVEMVPRPEPSLISSYTRPGPVDKVNRATLPEEAEVRVLEHSPVHDRFAVSSPTSFPLRLYTFFFPGWHAYVDGQEVEIELGLPEGFIVLDLPAGEHEVEVRFEDTPPRRAGWRISAAGLVVLGIALIVVPATGEKVGTTHPLTRRGALWLGGGLVVYALFRFAVVAPQESWLRYTSPPGEVWAARYSQHAIVGGSIELLGFDLPQRRVRSGQQLPVVLYWRARGPVEDNYQAFVHLTSPSSISWGQSDALNPGGLPTSRWSPERYVWDVHHVQVKPGTPPGEYTLEVGLYTLHDGRRLPVSASDGSPAGETAVLRVPVRVLPARRPPDEAELGLDEEVRAVYNDQVTLLGYVLPAPVVEAPGFIHLTLFWRAEHRHPDDLVITVAVVDDTGEPVRMLSGPPVGGRYPVAEWARGEVVRDPYAFWMDETFQAGIYTVGVVVHRGHEPITPEGETQPFLELFQVEVHP